MLTAEDYKRLSKQAVQLAIASEDPCVAQGLLQLALDYMAQVVSLSERAATDQLRQRVSRIQSRGSEIKYRNDARPGCGRADTRRPRSSEPHTVTSRHARLRWRRSL